MTDRTANLHLQAADGYAGGFSEERIAVTRSKAAVRRSRKTMVRVGPQRESKSTRTLSQTYALTYDVDLSDATTTLALLIDAIADKGSYQNTGDDHEWTLGRHDGFRTFSAFFDSADGTSYKLGRGIMQELAITAGTRKPVEISTNWEFGTIEEIATAAADIEDSAGLFASGLTTTLKWNGTDLPAFSASLTISRDLAPGAVGPDGIPTGYTGAAAPSVVGRIAARCSAAEADDLFITDLTRSLEIRIAAGTAVLTITFPAVNFAITNRRIVDNGQVEHQLEFLATMTGSNALATFALVT